MHCFEAMLVLKLFLHFDSTFALMLLFLKSKINPPVQGSVHNHLFTQLQELQYLRRIL